MSSQKKNANSPSKDNPHGGYVEFGTEHLRDRLALFKGIIPRRAIRKDCACYHFDVHPNGSATVAGTDLENRLLLTLEVLSHTGVGTVMVEAHALDAMIGSYAEPRLRLHLDHPTKVRVEGLQSKLILPGADPAKEAKATVEGCLTAAGWMIRGSDLATALERTRFATDPASTRYAFSGVALVFPETGEAPMEMVATDGRRLAVCRVAVRRHGDPPRVWRPEAAQNVYLPILAGKAIPAALKLARLVGDQAIGLAVIPGTPKDLEATVFDPGLVQVVTRDAVLTARVPDGRFPRFRDVWPSDVVKAELRLDDARRLGTLLESATSATDSEHKGVEIVLAGGCLMMTVISQTKGKAVLSLLVPDSEGRATFDVDALMLRQFFDVVGDAPMRLRFYGANAPIVLTAGPDYDFVQMPLTRDERPAPATPQTEATPSDEGGGKGNPPAQDEGDDSGGATVKPTPEPEPVAPVATTPDAHQRNGKARPTPRGKS
jgi:DNA polymerase III sliding clamp (beta) subunit (PCNA family)